MKIILKILLILWQLPQSLVFFGVWLFLKCRDEIGAFDYSIYWIDTTYKITLWHNNDYLTSCGLGEFLILKDERADTKTYHHELGHCKQSLYLGWLYLIVVGLPSVILNLLSRKSDKIRENYYSYFPENWADRLGGVDR